MVTYQYQPSAAFATSHDVNRNDRHVRAIALSFRK